MAGQWHVIGISGVTCGGKSTITTKLKESLPLPVTIINQDDYFLTPGHENHSIIQELNHANWEILTSLDMEKLLNDVKTILNSIPDKTQILIIEGILILNYKPLADILNQKFYLTLTKDECLKRRKLRTYDPPDPPGYFEICVWPMYEKHFKDVLDEQNNTVFLDGAQPMNKTYELVKSMILDKLTK